MPNTIQVYGGKMKRPMDPRKHGLKTPTKTIVEEHKFRIAHSTTPGSYYDNIARCSLNQALELYESKRVEASYDGKTIIEGPFIDSQRTEMSLTFKTERKNPLYIAEKTGYDAQLKEYEEKVKAYEDWLKRKEAGIKEKMDVQILRMEHKLANLKAVRDEEPIPFPDD